MSLFQAREFWTAATGAEEEFGSGCLAVANLDNDPSGTLKMATGSFGGMLRLYYPRERDFKLEDLMLEQNMERPILQLLAGRFMPDSERIAIAVLHPRALVVYTVTASASSGGGKSSPTLPSYFMLSKLYEHPLERPACNMVGGAFGGVYGREHICVQSMDGYVTLIEQERLVSSRQLSKFLLPGPMAYCTKADCFVTFNSQMEIDCYKYSSLSASGAGSEKSKAPLEWSSVLGETCVAIVVARCSRVLTSSQVDIVVIAERTLLCYRESGAIRLQRRLDYTPCCCAAYPSLSTEAGAPEHHLLVGTHSGSVMIYRDLELVWAARLTYPAMALRVGTFANTAGLLVHMSSDGQLGLSYLGTDPPTSTVETEAKELNYEAMDEEHRRLLQTIREASSGSKPEPSDGVTLRAQVPTLAEAVNAGEDAGGAVTMVTVRLFVSYTGSATLDNVSLTASCAPPIFLTADAVTIPSLAGGNRTPTIVPFTFRARADELPVDLTACVAATYTVASGEPRCARCEFGLPLSMVAAATPPVKNPKFKVTLDTNRPPPPLAALFEDVLAAQPQLAEAMSQPGVGHLSIEYHVGLDSSVLVSKSAGRYRVQSSTLEGIWLLADELVRRLTAYFNSAQHRTVVSVGVDGSTEEPFHVVFAEPLPLHEYFELIDDHLQCRHALAELFDQLGKRAHQLRVIEKRLLVRIKDRNPAPMANLELLFDGTYRQLMELAEQAETAQQQRRFYATRLSAGTRLLLFLLRLRFALDTEDYGLLVAHLTPIVDETPDQGWQERTDAALTHLLRNGLSKTGKDGSAAQQVTSLQRPADASKLKKHITLVCDRLHKGLRPTGAQGSQANGEAK